MYVGVGQRFNPFSNKLFQIHLICSLMVCSFRKDEIKYYWKKIVLMCLLLSQETFTSGQNTCCMPLFKFVFTIREENIKRRLLSRVFSIFYILSFSLFSWPSSSYVNCGQRVGSELIPCSYAQAVQLDLVQIIPAGSLLHHLSGIYVYILTI